MKEITLQSYQELFGDNCSSCLLQAPPLLAEKEDYALPHRRNNTHKYSYGRALIIAGSAGFSGAPVLAANACERSGAGLTTLMVPDSIYGIAAGRCDGAVVTLLPSDKNGSIAEAGLYAILSALEKASACVIGPGLRINDDTAAVVAEVARQAKCPLVLDADALTICGEHPEILSSCSVPLVLTPHEGEFRRIGGSTASGRLPGALAFTAAHPGATLLLKGYGTLICSGDRAVVNPTGSPAIAKGGSGDVLCGILCALLAQGFDPFFSAGCAAWLHGRAGDLAAEELGEYSVTPSDIISRLPAAFKELL